MEDKDVDLWWDAIKDIVQKDLGKVCRKYERNERLYIDMISKMEKVMPSFEYEPLVLSPKWETSNEEEDRRDIDGVRPSNIRVIEEPRNLKGRKDRYKREVVK